MMNEKAFRQAIEESRNGVNKWLRHSLVRFFVYSDGVQECAEAGCYWLLDIIATEIASKIRSGINGDHHGWVVVVVKDKSAKITLEIEEDKPVYTRKVGYTDMPAGRYEFEIGYDGTNVLFSLISEH